MIDAAEVVAGQMSQAMILETRLSDLIVINKSDLALSGTKELQVVLQQLNSDAAVVVATQAEIDVALLTQSESHAEVSFARVFPEIGTIELEEASYAVLDLDGPLDPEKVHSAFKAEEFAPGIRLRRAKGFFIDHDGEQWQVEATAKHIELRKLKKPKRQVLVAIGEGVTKKALREVLL
jgi:G3E family GTPase